MQRSHAWFATTSLLLIGALLFCITVFLTLPFRVDAFEPTETTVTGSTKTTVNASSVGGLSAGSTQTLQDIHDENETNIIKASGGSTGSSNSVLGNDTGSGAGTFSAFQSWISGGSSGSSGGSSGNLSSKSSTKPSNSWADIWSQGSGNSSKNNGSSATTLISGAGSVVQTQQDPNYFSVAAKNIWGSLFNGAASNPTTGSLIPSSYLFSPSNLTDTSPGLIGGRYFPSGSFSKQSVVLDPSAAVLVGGNVLPTSLQTSVKTSPVAGFANQGAAMADTSVTIVTTLTGTWRGLQKVTSDLGTQIFDVTNGLLTGRDLSTVQGIRNNNPGNIVCSSVQWNGATGCDGNFVTFGPIDATCDAACAGIRAGLINLKNMQLLNKDPSKQENITINEVISRWAPAAGGNDTNAYIAFVAQATGYGANDKIDLSDPVVATKVFAAIMTKENGGIPYTQDQVLSGVNAAFGTSAGTSHVLVGDARSSVITVLNTTTNTPEGTIQAAPNPSDQPLNQQVAEIAGKAFMDGLMNVVTGKQSPNDAIGSSVVNTLSQALPLVFQQGSGSSVQVPSGTQNAVGNVLGMVMQYVPGVGNPQGDALNAIANNFGTPSQAQTGSGKAVLNTGIETTGGALLGNDVGSGASLPDLQDLVNTQTKGSSAGSMTNGTQQTTGGFFGSLGTIVNSGFSLIKTAYSSGSGQSSGDAKNSNTEANTPLTNSSVGVPIDRTLTSSFVKVDPVTGKDVITNPATPVGGYYDRGLAVALELVTKEQALKKANVDYTVKDGEIIITVPAKGFTEEEKAFLSVAQKYGIDPNNSTQVAGALFMSQGAKGDTLAARLKDYETTLSGMDQVTKIPGTAAKVITDLATGKNTVTADKNMISLAKTFRGLVIPSGTGGFTQFIRDQIDANNPDGALTPAQVQSQLKEQANQVVITQKGATLPLNSLPTAAQAEYLGVSDTEYQNIQKISDTTFGATGGDAATPVKMTLMKVVNTTEEDAKCRSSIVCSIAVAPFGGVEGVRKTFDTIMAQNSPSTPGLFPVAGMTRINDDPSLNDTFGAGRPGGRLHAGDDIYTPSGTPVVAVMDGVVRRADNDDPTGYGLRIDIEYPDGTVQRMAHLGKIEVRPGQTVKAGQVVGLSGRSGIESAGIGDHVHYEVIKKDAYDSGQAKSAYDEKTLEEGRIDPAAYFENLNAKAAAVKPSVSNPTNLPLRAAYDLFNKVFPRPQEIVVDSNTAQKFLNSGQTTETPTGNGGGTGTGNGGATNPPRQNASDLINPWANGGSGGNNNAGGRGTTSTTTVATSTNNFIGNFLGGLLGGIGGGKGAGSGASDSSSNDIGTNIVGLVGNIFGTILGGVTGSSSGGVNGIGGILQGFGNIFSNVFGQALSGNNAGGTGQNADGTGNQDQGVTPLVAQRPDIVCNPNSVKANQSTSVTVSWVCYGSTSADGIGFPIRGGAPAANIAINVGATSTAWLSYGIKCSNGTTRSCVIPVNP